MNWQWIRYSVGGEIQSNFMVKTGVISVLYLKIEEPILQLSWLILYSMNWQDDSYKSTISCRFNSVSVCTNIACKNINTFSLLLYWKSNLLLFVIWVCVCVFVYSCVFLFIYIYNIHTHIFDKQLLSIVYLCQFSVTFFDSPMW